MAYMCVCVCARTRVSVCVCVSDVLNSENVCVCDYPCELCKYFSPQPNSLMEVMHQRDPSHPMPVALQWREMECVRERER